MSVLRMTEEQVKAHKRRVLRPCTSVQATTPLPKARKARGGGLKGRSKHSDGELALTSQLRQGRVTGWEREYRFSPPRRWRFDVAFPERRLGIEVEGGIWVNGGHNRGGHFTEDMEKYNAAALAGWAVLRFTTDQAKNGYAYQTIMDLLRR